MLQALPPRGAGLLRSEDLAQRFRGRHGFAWRVPAAELKRNRPAVNGRKNAFPNKSIETLFSDPAVVVQLIPPLWAFAG